MLTHRFADLAADAWRAEQAPAVLSVAELARAQRFRRPIDRERYLVAHIGLRQMLADALGVPPVDVPIGAAPCVRCGALHGRPELPSSSGLYFSLSRSRDFAAYAVANEPVGIDIEVIPSADAAAEMRLALHPSEVRSLGAVPAVRRPQAIARCWVRKEAALKATGHGLALDPALLAVGVGGPPPGLLQVGDRSVHSVADLDAPPGYASAVALAARP